MNLKFFKKIFPFISILIFIMSSENIIYVSTNASEQKIIYLTFDDGPAGKVTKDILEILKNESVPATFFFNRRSN